MNTLKENNKPIVKICFNGVKNYNSNGSRNLYNSFSSRFKGDIEFYKNNGYILTY